MSWSKNRLPKYRKHRASGQAIVTLCGVDHYLGPYGTKVSMLEYDRLIGEWLANGRNSLLNSRHEISVVELSARYWKFAKGYYQKNGQPTGTTDAIKQAVRFLKDWYGPTVASEFGPLALKAVRERMVDDGLSRTYINALVDNVRRMFKWGVGEQLIPAEIYHALATVPGLRRGRTEARETAPVQPVVDSTVEATLPHLPSVVADMVRFQRLTGCWPAEACILRPCDLDRSGDIWTYKPESHKTEHHGRERIVFVGPKVQALLLRYLARDSQAYCFRPCDSEKKRRAAQHEARVTPQSCGNSIGTNRTRRPKRQAGGRYTTDSYRRAITRACEKHAIEKWSPNRLRHTAATEVRREFGLEAAQVILGHSQANVTQVYAERDLAKGVEVARQIG